MAARGRCAYGQRRERNYIGSQGLCSRNNPRIKVISGLRKPTGDRGQPHSWWARTSGGPGWFARTPTRRLSALKVTPCR